MDEVHADRPWVSVNFALTADGRISTRNNTPADYSSKRDKRRLIELRSAADAVAVSAATAAADRMTMGIPDPSLREARVARGQSAYPLRILISGSGNIDANLPLFTKSFSPILIFSTQRMPAAARAALEAKASVILAQGEALDLTAMMRTLRREHGVKSLDFEGGGRLFRALLQEGLVDEIHITLCPILFGGRAAPTLTGLAGDYLPQSTPLALQGMKVIEGECYLHYVLEERLSAECGSTPLAHSR